MRFMNVDINRHSYLLPADSDRLRAKGASLSEQY
jgi:hypothetical protein